MPFAQNPKRLASYFSPYHGHAPAPGRCRYYGHRATARPRVAHHHSPLYRTGPPDEGTLPAQTPVSQNQDPALQTTRPLVGVPGTALILCGLAQLKRPAKRAVPITSPHNLYVRIRAHHASRVDSERVARIPVLMFRDLLERRLFDGVRLFDHWYVLVVDGSVKEKCRQGFHAGGKSSAGDARYRYVLQLSVIGPEGTLFPLMHEEMDVQNPQTEKEDCELQSFQRLSQRLKRSSPDCPAAWWPTPSTPANPSW